MVLRGGKMVFKEIAHLHVLWISTLGYDRSAMLQSPPQQRLCRTLVMLHCNCTNLLVLHIVTALMPVETVSAHASAQKPVHM